jgi:protein tyrosine phosphatase (PTP) superfamily phosphohydrolase (DUF442 family)
LFSAPVRAQAPTKIFSELALKSTEKSVETTLGNAVLTNVGKNLVATSATDMAADISSYAPQTKITLTTDQLRQTIQAALTGAQQTSLSKAYLLEKANEVSALLSDFIRKNHRFPEQHYGEEVSDLSPEQLQAIAKESALRAHIDFLVDQLPEAPLTKYMVTLRNDLAQQQLEQINQTMEQVSPFQLFFQDATLSQITTPVALNSTGLPNAYQLTENFYRGGQPTEEGYRILSKMGVKTIISFRTHKPNKELIESLGMESVHIPLNPALITPTQMTRFLQLVADPTHQPVYVHCHFGSDRTGVMVAIYRLIIQKWSKEKALAEMQDPKFGFNKIFFTLPSYIKYANVEKITGNIK